MGRFFFVMMFVLSVVASGLPRLAAAETGRKTVDTHEYTLEGVYPENACAGEGISFRSVVQLEVSEVRDAQRATHFLLKQPERGTGMGLASGATYQLAGVNNWTIHALPTRSQVLTLQGHGKTIG